MLAAFAVTAFNADAKSFKRGVSENAFTLTEEMDVLVPGCSWLYNWANTPTSNADYMSDDNLYLCVGMQIIIRTISAIIARRILRQNIYLALMSRILSLRQI